MLLIQQALELEASFKQEKDSLKSYTPKLIVLGFKRSRTFSI